MNYLKSEDSIIYKLQKAEEKRQEETLMMIPSENITSRAVQEAVGSVFMNKYAEGYPHRRYYQGQAVVDELEDLVRERAKKLFNVAAVNVQPHSGSPANFAVYTGLLHPTDKIMGLSLSSGGHLTHGAAMNASSKYFRSVSYDVGRDGLIDYTALMKLAKTEKPAIIVAGTTAYARILDWKKFADIAEEVDAFLLADMSHVSGLVAAGVYPSPAPHVHIITTTTHKTLRGPRGAMIMTTHKGIKKDPDLAKKIDKAIIPGIQGGPHLHTIAGIGVALKEAQSKKYVSYAKQVVANAKKLAEELIKYDFKLITNGTDSHLILIDLTNKNLLGNTAAEALEAVGIVLNRNGVPFDPNPPFYPSGIRLGTPGITSRGLQLSHMKQIASWMNEVISATALTKEKLGVSKEEEKKRSVRETIVEKTTCVPRIRKEVRTLCRAYPILKSYI